MHHQTEAIVLSWSFRVKMQHIGQQEIEKHRKEEQGFTHSFGNGNKVEVIQDLICNLNTVVERSIELCEIAQ